MSLGIMVLLAALAYGISIVALKGAQFMDSNLFATVMNFIGGLLPISLYLWLMKNGKTDPNTTKGLAYAVVGGLAIGAFIILVSKIFSSGQNLSFISPLVWGGGILFATLIGVIVYKEPLGVWNSFGVLTITAGILMISYSSYIGIGATK